MINEAQIEEIISRIEQAPLSEAKKALLELAELKHPVPADKVPDAIPIGAPVQHKTAKDLNPNGKAAFNAMLKEMEQLKPISDPYAASHMVEALCAIDPENACEYLVRCSKQIASPWRRILRLPIVMTFGYGDAITEALIVLLHDEDQMIRLTAADVLGSRARMKYRSGVDKKAVRNLISALEGSEAKARCKILWALGLLGSDDPEVSNTLGRFLADKKWEIRREAALAIMHCGPRAAHLSDDLMMLGSDPKIEVRIEVLRHLPTVDKDSKGYHKLYLDALAGDNDKLISAALEGLALQDKSAAYAREAVERLLERKDTKLTKQVIITLGKIGCSGPQTLEKLRQFAETASKSIRDAAKTALKELGV